MGQGGNTTSARAHFVSLLSVCTHFSRIGVWTVKEERQPACVNRRATDPWQSVHIGKCVGMAGAERAYLDSVCHGGSG